MDNKSLLKENFSAWINRYDVIFTIVGAIVGGVVGAEYVSAYLVNMNNVYATSAAIGTNGDAILYILNVLCGGALAFVFFRTMHSFLDNQVKEEPDEIRKSDDFSYQLPNWPTMNKKFYLILGEKHESDGIFKFNPSWYRIPEKGLYGNMIAFGGIGTGKTQAVAYPLLRQFFEFKPQNEEQKIGGLILDVKGDFNQKVFSMAKEYGREKDIIIIKPGGKYKWNPIHSPHIDAEVLASRLIAIYENISGDPGTGSNAWVGQGVKKLLTHAIGLYRLAHGYVTIQNLNDLISKLSADGDEAAEEIENELEYFDDLASNLSGEDEETYQFHRLFFTTEWKRENPRNKGTIGGATSNVTGMFSKPSIAKTFCPKEDEIDFPGFDELINNGQIITIDMPKSIYQSVGVAVGILLKMEFQIAAKARVSRAVNDPNVNTKRNLFFICDEYQNFVTVSGASGEGDDGFYSESRQSKVISMLLTQSPISLQAKVGEEKMRVILASIRTKIFLTIIDPKDQELAADICGKDWKNIENVTLSEQVQNAGWNPINNSMGGSSSTVSEQVSFQSQMTHIIDPISFSKLRAFECIANVFDGIKQRDPWKIYLKADFVPEMYQEKYNSRKIPFNLMIKELEKEN